MCAGIIGYQALRRAALPPSGRLGIYSFGPSAHLAAQLAIARGAEVHVLTRGSEAQRLALEPGAASARDPRQPPPVGLDSAILFAPVGDLVPSALAALERAARSRSRASISDIPQLNCQRHLFGERTLTSVTANTRADRASSCSGSPPSAACARVSRRTRSRQPTGHWQTCAPAGSSGPR